MLLYLVIVMGIQGMVMTRENVQSLRFSYRLDRHIRPAQSREHDGGPVGGGIQVSDDDRRLYLVLCSARCSSTR